MDIPDDLTAAIARLPSRAIVAVSGFGGAGKSGLASALARRIDAPVVGIDSFIRDRNLTRYTRWELMDFGRLEREVLRPFSEGRAVSYGHFDWQKNAVGEHRGLHPGGPLIVEGVGLFRPELRRYFSLLVWVDCPLPEAIARGKKRDRDEYGNPQDDSWDGIWKENDELCYREYQPGQIADFIIDNSARKQSGPVP